jgi:hypothetical protein
VKGIPTVLRNRSSLESGADRIWASSDLPADEMCCTLKPAIANTMVVASTIAVASSPPRKAARVVALRALTQTMPTRRTAGARIARAASKGLVRATGCNRRIRHSALA